MSPRSLLLIIMILIQHSIAASNATCEGATDYWEEAHKILYRDSRPCIPSEDDLARAAQFMLAALPRDYSGDVTGLLRFIGLDPESTEIKPSDVCEAWKAYVERLS